MTAPPSRFRILTDDRVLELTWPDGRLDRIDFRRLRQSCPCANCIDETTGIRTLDVDGISQEIQPVDVGYSGSYAVKFTWSDGHDTGLYTWEHLDRVGRSASTSDRPADDTRS